MEAYSVENHPNDSRVRIFEDGTVQTLTSRIGTGGGNVPLVIHRRFSDVRIDDGRVCGTLERSGGTGGQNVPMVLYRKSRRAMSANDMDYVVRRLTPLECCRLQGFPDGWADIEIKDDLTEEEYSFWLDVRQTFDKINGRDTKNYSKDSVLKWYNKLHTDSAEYKMWGNGIALPNALYVMQGIEDVFKREEKE